MRETPPTEWEPTGIIERFLAWRGRRHVNEHYVQIVYRDRKFNRVAGPHYFWTKGREQLGKTIYLGLRFAKLEFNNLSSIEPVRVGLRVSISYFFDPRKIGGDNPSDPAAVHALTSTLVELPDASFHKVVDGYALPLLRRIVAKYRLAEIQRGEFFEELEIKVKQELKADANLKRLGIQIGNVQIEDCMLPATIDQRLQDSASTNIVRDDMYKAGSAEVAFATMVKSVDKLSGSSGETYVSTDGLMSNLKEMADRTSPQVRIVESIPASNSGTTASNSGTTASTASTNSASASEPANFYPPRTETDPREQSFGD